ncbi:MAG: Hsp20/alpha crystallin family protein [Treponema sp.]|nr:Hsp20/alpha crystallin family protein [Treponema sp.]
MKTLSLYHPNTIQTVLSDLDRYIESFFGDSSVLTTRMTNQIPAVDIQENEHCYVLDMELPGLDEKNIDVHVDGANLTIASKQETLEEKKGEEKQNAYLIKERKANVFSRSFKLPENADPQEVSAAFKNGVLSLQIKKRAEAQKRIIQINAA